MPREFLMRLNNIGVFLLPRTRSEPLNTVDYPPLAIKMTTWTHRCVSLQCCCVQPSWQPVKAPMPPFLSAHPPSFFPSDFFGWPDPETDGSDQAPLLPPRRQDNLPNPLQSYSELDSGLYWRRLCLLTHSSSHIVCCCCCCLKQRAQTQFRSSHAAAWWVT